MSTPNIVTRFAPSPTGYLHVGGARTALFNWLLARHLGGKFVLRIEDTDLARSTEHAVIGLLDDLKWLGLQWDNTELVYQSKRLNVYNAIIEDFLKRGLAYEAWETPEELDTQRKIAERSKRAYIYRRPTLSEEQVAKFRSESRKSIVRFAMPVKDYRFHDVVLGKEIIQAANQVQDFVIRKTDGMPTYHFAVVVDDAEMGITHILRGQEHLLNTINHIALQEALGAIRPIYGHLPIILNIDGSKMGKRDRDKKVRIQTHNWIKNSKKTIEELSASSGIDSTRLKEWITDDAKQLDPTEHALIMPHIGLKESDLPEILVHDFRKNGYLPEVLNNFLALLGWSPGGDRERMSMDELVKLFSVEGIGKSNAKFNRDKLQAFSTEAATAAPMERMIPAMRDFLAANPDSPLNSATDSQLADVIRMNAGFHILSEVDEKSRFFLVPCESIRFDKDAVDKVLLKNEKQGLNALREASVELKNVSDWSAGTLESTVKTFCDSKKLGLGKVAQPIRVAISGTTISPPIFESLVFLGRDKTLKRIENCLASVR